jgi:2-oxoglutarate ferredoxin oxidoreductase subunit beta
MVSFVPPRDEITVEDFEEGTVREVLMHDGSQVILKKLHKEYDPTSRWDAIHMLEEANINNWLMTGLIYVDTDVPSMVDMHNLVDRPLNRLQEKDLRPSRASLERINQSMA